MMSCRPTDLCCDTARRIELSVPTVKLDELGSRFSAVKDRTFRALCDYPVDEPCYRPTFGKGSPQVQHRLRRAASSQGSEHFVSDKVQSDLFRSLTFSGSPTVKEVSLHCLAHIRPKVMPSVRLREDVSGQALGAVASVRLLSYLEDQFGHASILLLDGLLNRQPVGIRAKLLLKLPPCRN